MKWKLKLKALLHDPPFKMLVFDEKDKYPSLRDIETKSPHNHQLHERWAEGLLNYLLHGECIKEDHIKYADRLASAQSRIVVKPQLKEEFEKESTVSFKELFFIDIFSLSRENVDYPDAEKVKELFEKLGNISPQNEKLFFLFLWRFLPEIFSEIEKHPADGRAPNHSIYDHVVQTSAIVSTLPKPAFFLFTIGPVQSFIARARKTQDLWAGSYMLSYLIWKSMEPLVEKLGPDVIIFPNLLGQPLVDRWLANVKFGSDTFKSKVEGLKTELSEYKEVFSKFVDNAYSDDKLTIANLPNRFLAVIPYEKNEHISQAGKDLAKKVEKSFEEELKNLARKIVEYELDEKDHTKIKDVSSNPNLQSDIENQLLSYFKAYWVVLPWSEKGLQPIEGKSDKLTIFPDDALKDYKELFAENELYQTIDTIVKHPYYRPANVGSAYALLVELTEKLLGARKSVRDFKPLEQPGEKCHLCGEFEVLWLVSETKDWKGKKKENDEKWEDLRKSLGKGLLKKGERLCGICLTKRLFPEIIKEELGLSDRVKFPSTSEMASVGEKRRLENGVKNNFKAVFTGTSFYNKLPKTVSVPALKNDALYNIDGQWLMEESYRVDYFDKEYGFHVQESDFQSVLSFIKQNSINPSRYYAILQMDGDHMGKWLKGEFNPKIGEVIHPKVKDALLRYSEGNERKEMEKILCSYHPTSPSLHQAFSRKLSQFALEHVRKIVEDEHYGKLVYAGGDDVLALLPVEEVLQCAYDLQKKFKEVLSPKATMSAGILIVHHKFPLYLALKEVQKAEKRAKNHYGRNAFCIKFLKHSGEERECGGKWEDMDFMKDLICKFKAEEISTRFPYQFLEVVEIVGDSKEILKSELKRIFMRKEGGDKDMLKDYLENQLLPQFEKITGRTSVKNFASMLVIAVSLAKEMRV